MTVNQMMAQFLTNQGYRVGVPVPVQILSLAHCYGVYLLLLRLSHFPL